MHVISNHYPKIYILGIFKTVLIVWDFYFGIMAQKYQTAV